MVNAGELGWDQDLRIFRVHLWRLVREGVIAFIDDQALSRGAAIAFYAVTALAPVLFITITIASLGFGRDAASGAIASQLRHLMSKESADIVELAIRNSQGLPHSILGSAVGVLILLVTASGVFGEMQDALNVIWKAPPNHPMFLHLLRGRILSLGLVMTLGFLLLVSMVLTAGITALGRYVDENTMFSQFVLSVVNSVISFVLISFLFAAIYKILPNKALLWRDVIVGAIGTAFLFSIGQILLGLYLGSGIVASAYGAAGGLIVLLLWVYYSAQVFLLGAEFTKVWAQHFGSQQAETTDEEGGDAGG